MGRRARERKVRKVIFLDIDGVLNNHTHAHKRGPDKKPLGYKVFDPESVMLLNWITDSTDAEIVISSMWREKRTLDELREVFFKQGITGEVIDVTPVLGTERGKEVDAWLDANLEMGPIRFVIIDDTPEFDMFQMESYVQTDANIGLRKEHADKAIKLLKGIPLA